MSWRAAGCLPVAVAFLAACGASEEQSEGENADAPAAQAIRAFYGAANRSAGAEACALLTARGIQQVVHVSSRDACVHTINGLDPGSFSSKSGELLHIEGVDEQGADAFDVDAQLEGRSGGTYTVVDRSGRLLIDGFEPDEG